MSSPALSKDDYERRKCFLEELKHLTNDQYQEVFRIIKRNEVEFSENSNGIFFDIASLSSDIFKQLEQIIELSKVQNKSEEERNKELNTLRNETKVTDDA
jgi:hypothetical protein